MLFGFVFVELLKLPDSLLDVLLATTDGPAEPRSIGSGQTADILAALAACSEYDCPATGSDHDPEHCSCHEFLPYGREAISASEAAMYIAGYNNLLHGLSD